MGRGMGTMLQRLLEWLRGLGSSATPEPAADVYGLRERIRKDEDHARLYQLAKDLEGLFEVLSHPSELGKSELYAGAVRVLEQLSFSTAELCTFALGDNHVLNCVALDAMRRR